MNSLRLKKIMKESESKKITADDVKQILTTDVKFEFRRSFMNHRSPYIHLF